MSTGWEWIEDSERRGQEAADRREGIVRRLVDKDDDPWLDFGDGTVCPDGWGGGRSDRRDITQVQILWGPLTEVHE